MCRLFKFNSKNSKLNVLLHAEGAENCLLHILHFLVVALSFLIPENCLGGVDPCTGGITWTTGFAP